MNFKANLEIYENPEKLYRCLMPENIKSGRSSFTMKKEKDHLIVNISAKDVASFRAALNSITQLLSVYKQAGELK